LLIKANVYNFSREYPEEYKRRFNYLMSRIRCEVVNKDDKVMIEVHFDNDDKVH
jgi:hypothetical protein